MNVSSNISDQRQGPVGLTEDNAGSLLQAPDKRRRRSRHRKKSVQKRRIKLFIGLVLLAISIYVMVQGLSMILASYEERRNIYATRAHCEIDYKRSECVHVSHNDLWYSPWYRVPKDQPSAGPDSTDPKYRNNRVVNVERRDPKKRLMNN